MKKIATLLIGCLCFVTCHAQNTLTVADWQSDLRFLQTTVHKDYAFLFKKITAEQFDAQVDQLYKAIPSMQPHEVIAGLGGIVASFQYGHTDIGWNQTPIQAHILPLNLYAFSDGVYIEGAHKDYASIVGAKVLKIEGMAIDKAMEAIKPLVPVENEEYFKAYGLDMLLIPEALHAQRVTRQLKNNITMTLEKGGKTYDQTITAVNLQHLPRHYGFVAPNADWVSARDQNTTPYYLKNLDKIYYFEYLPAQKTVYVRHSQIQDDPSEDIPTFYNRVFDFIEKNDVERLVIDVRLNGGGNNYKNKPIITGIIRTAKINQPGKLFVIIGRRTFSACQNLVNEMDHYTNAIFVGEPTAENINFYGDNRKVELPTSKIPVYLSFAWWQDKPQWENDQWLAPHIATDITFEDYQANHDPALEAALQFSGKDLILDPMGHLQALFLANKLDEVEAEATKMVNDPRYRFFKFEEEFNNTGYNLLRNGRMEPAIYVFQLNAKLFPESANVWDSLAEAHWKANHTDKAIEYYNKAIEMDPNGPTGDNARSMLKQIKK